MIKWHKESFVQVTDLIPEFNEAAKKPRLNNNETWHYQIFLENIEITIAAKIYICYVKKFPPLTHTLLVFIIRANFKALELYVDLKFLEEELNILSLLGPDISTDDVSKNFKTVFLNNIEDSIKQTP